MSLSEKDKRDMLSDGKNPARRVAFRLGRAIQGPRTFEDYISALDDLQQMASLPSRTARVPYKNVKL
jgi:hypothetical protein